jgi:hypothetical protein
VREKDKARGVSLKSVHRSPRALNEAFYLPGVDETTTVSGRIAHVRAEDASFGGIRARVVRASAGALRICDRSRPDGGVAAVSVERSGQRGVLRVPAIRLGVGRAGAMTGRSGDRAFGSVG